MNELSPGILTDGRIDRRGFLRRGLIAAAAVLPTGTLLSVPGCESRERAAMARLADGRAPTEPFRERRLVAHVGEVDLGPLGPYRTWLYDGRFPGPEVRVREGDRLRVTLENRLPEGTTVHWHGIPVPNAMDGVPGVTQDAVPPGSSFVYDYAAEPAGSYLYHSHVGLQIDRGLLGPLVIEERTPHIEYDTEHTLVLDDFLADAPRPMAGGGMMGGMMRQRGRGVPDYRAFLIGGRPPSDPAVYTVRQGERVRLRLLNPTGATVFRVALAAHRLQVTHADGRPVRPVEVDALLIAPGERYDVVVEANNPGTWNLTAASVNAGPGTARAVLRYAGVAGTPPREGDLPEGIRGGRLLSLVDLQSVETTGDARRRPDRIFDLTLSGGMMMSRGWSIDGQRHPDAEPLSVRRGERVRVNMINHSMAIHPMHLHGHFFRVGDALKDTVVVPPHMGRVSFEFTADNPGDWLFHCHNIYHMESGMARIFHYTG